MKTNQFSQRFNLFRFADSQFFFFCFRFVLFRHRFYLILSVVLFVSWKSNEENENFTFDRLTKLHWFSLRSFQIDFLLIFRRFT